MSDTITLGRPTDHLLVTLDRWDDGQINVWNVELMGDGMRHRTSFSEGRMMQDVFTPALARRLRDLLASLDRHTRIFSDAEFELRLPGAVVRGIRVMIAQATDSFDRILVRFREVVGSIASLFSGGEGAAAGHADARHRAAVAALSDIVLPVCDLADGLRDVGAIENQDPDRVARHLDERIAALSEKADSMRLYMHLLMRYLEDEASGRARAELPDALAGLDFARR